MAERIYKTHDDLLNELMKDPEFVKESRRQKPYYDIVREVIALRARLGITQEELARRAKTYQSRISKIESAEHDMRLSTLIAIADAMDAEVDIRLVPHWEPTDQDYFALFDISTSSAIPERLSQSTGREYSIETT